MTDEAWILTSASESVEEKTVTLSKSDDGKSIMGIYRRKVGYFTYTRKTCGAFSWTSPTTVDGGPFDTRLVAYDATIDTITTAIVETKKETDTTPWKLIYTYIVAEAESE
jgi:hypothetical protein